SAYAGAITYDTTSPTIRKLVVRNETLNITGGALNVGYVHVAPRAIDFGPEAWSALIDGTVNLSGTGQLSAHTVHVQNARTLGFNGGELISNTVLLNGNAKIGLSGDATFTGLAGGTLNINSGVTAIGSVDLTGGTRKLTVTNGAAAVDLAVNVPIVNGGLTKAGAGTMNLTAPNTLAGAIAIDGGTLRLSGASGHLNAASDYTVRAGGTLQLDNDVTNHTNRLSDTATVRLRGGTFDMIGNASSVRTETIGPLTAEAGASTLSLSNLVTLTKSGGGGYGRAFGATLNFVNADSARQVLLVSSGTGSFVDQGSFVNGAEYAVHDPAGYVRAMVAGGGSFDYSTTIAANRHVKLAASGTLVATQTINTLNLAGAVAGLTMNAGANLTLTNGGIIKSGGGASTISSLGAGTISTGALTDYVVNTVAAADQLTVSVPLTGGFALAKSGAGTLVLTSTGNSYGGDTYVNQGTLRLGATEVIPATSKLFVRGGGSLNMNGFGESIGNVTFEDASSITGTGTLTLTGVNPIISAAGPNGGSVISNTAITMSATGGAQVTFDAADGTADADLTISSIIQPGTSVLPVAKTGAGKIIFSGNNTFNAQLNINQGTLSVPAINASATTAQPLGASSAGINIGSVGAATLEYTGAAAATLNRSINVNGASGGTIRATSGALTIGLSVVGNGNPITFDTPAAAANITVAGVVGGVNSTLTKTGPGTLTLSNAANTYTGGTFINGGVLAYSTQSALGASGTMTFNGGTLRTLAAISDGRTLVFNAAGGTIDTNGFNSTFTNVSNGVGGLTKTGAGTLTLSNLQNYSGLTTINAGTLYVGADLHPSSTVMINSGGTLAGAGLIRGSAHVFTGGTINLSSGGSISGSLTANGGTWSGTGSVIGAVNVNTYNANFIVNGTLSTGGGVNVNMGTLAGAGTISGTVNLTNAGAINLGATGNIAASLNVGAGGGEWRGAGNVAGSMTVTNDAFGVTGNLVLNPPSFTTATLGGGGSLIMNAGTTLWGWGTINKTLTLNNNVRLAGTPARGALTINSPVTWGATGLQIYGGTIITQGDTITGGLQISGTARGQLAGTGVATINAGTVTLLGAADIAKPVTLTGGGTLTFTSYIDKDTGAVGDPLGDSTYFGTISSTLDVNGIGGNWNGPGTVTGLINASAGTFALGATANITAPASLTVSGTGMFSGAATSTINGSVNYTSSATNTIWAGNITGAGKTLTVNNNLGILSLTGVNTYTGQTTVNNGILLLAASNAINNTSGVVTTMGATQGGTVQLHNSVSINLPLSLGGAGRDGSQNAAPGSIGALNNWALTNTWAGTITLNGTGGNVGDAQLNQISATSGTLILSGVIQNGTGSSWAKTLDGDVVLTGGAVNTYTNITRILGGRLIVEKNGALGAAGLTTTGTGNTFQFAGSASTLAFRAPGASPGFSYNTFEVLNTEGTGAPGFGQIDNLGGNNTFTGQIALGGPTNGSGEIEASIGVTTGSLHVTGPLYARTAGATPRNITKLGAGRLILSGDSAPGTPNPSIVPLTNSTFRVASGVVELRPPSVFASNLPGVTTWTVDSGAAIDLASGVLATGTLNVAGNVNVASGAGKFVRAQVVNITGSGKIDLSDNDLIVDHAGVSPLGTYTGGAYTGITGLIATAFNAGGWDGPSGITSSAAFAAGGLTTIGVGEAESLLSLAPTETAVWNGQTVDGTSVLAMYTYAGDANLDGFISGDDYSTIDFNVGTSIDGYANGDFNYDGIVSGDDYSTIDFNIVAQGAPLGTSAPINAAVTAVPEPAACAFAFVAAALEMRRRRRRAR
ncbi:MAG: fibronectin-binding autotransporter adhesin, partial [Phycisphaerales bacterium]|nr:fibronectin-binding autotransporter adhesin [Phycisphaerales bacterium]